MVRHAQQELAERWGTRVRRVTCVQVSTQILTALVLSGALPAIVYLSIVVHTEAAMAQEGRRVAVIGSGISGLSAAWLLNRCRCVCVT